MEKWFNDITYWIRDWSFEWWLTITFGLACVALWFFSKVYNSKEAKIKWIPFILSIVLVAAAFFVGMAGPPIG